MYSKRFDIRPYELSVPVFVENPHFTGGRLVKALLHTGSQVSLIDQDLANNELRVMPTEGRRKWFRPSDPTPVVSGIKVCYVDVTTGDDLAFRSGLGLITRRNVEAAPVSQLLKERGFQITLGMNFLNSVDIAYFVGSQCALFEMFELP